MVELLRIFGGALSLLSSLTVLLTVCSLPWMLGGVVPLARLVLLCGAIVATLLSLASNLLRWRPCRSLPAIVVPLVAMAMLGVFQLTPATEHVASGMQHAVSGAVDVPHTGTLSHSLDPADTRSVVTTMLALSLVACVAFEQFRSMRLICCASLLLLANGMAVTFIGMTQLFHHKEFELNRIWSLGWSKGSGAEAFGMFINPNSAAGWLCLSVAVAAGWGTWHLRRSSTDPRLRHGRLRISMWGRLWQRLLEFMADLTVWQILSFAGIAFLAAGVASTASRGGILSLVVGILLTAVIRSSLRRLPLVLLLLAIGGAGAFATLRWLDLDEGVVGEMETLGDLSQAAGSRPQHWLDTLHLVRDFPLFGTGLGSYRFANLPYQTQYTGLWFRNADNHYIDMVVEGGVVGLLLFVAIGICGVFTGLAAWRQSKTMTIDRNKEIPRFSRRLVAALGTVVVLATLTQGAAAFLDYGIGMPPASALLVLIIAAAAGLVVESGADSSLRQAGAITVGTYYAAAVQLCLVSAAVSFLPDQVAATGIDEMVVAGHRILNQPEPDSLDRLSETRATLQRRLQKRRDDPEGLQMLSRLADAEFRWKFLLSTRGEAVRQDPGFALVWDAMTVQQLVDQLWRLERQNPYAAQRLRGTIIRFLNQTCLPQTIEYLQKRYPLMPGIADTRAEVALLRSDPELFEQQVAVAEFVEPAGADVLFNLGSLALRCGKSDLTQQLWDRSLAVSDRFRALMLTDGRNQWSEEKAMELFGPQNFVSCVVAADAAGNAALKRQLWKRAEVLWPDVVQPADSEAAAARATQLVATNRAEEAIAWLDTALEQLSDDLHLRRQHALLLEKAERYRDALEDWHSIQYLDPGNAEADAAVTRILQMK